MKKQETILNILTGNERIHSLSNIIPGSNILLEAHRLTRSETELTAKETAEKCMEYSKEFIEEFYEK
ncbi:MAG: hypothetical protein PHC56_07500 [Herbinix sp.]|nr:hypothetical protein [Herbinix sp.]